MLDAIVIGAGPAGLSGALYLARFRRSVLVVEDGGGRAARIPRSHNYPGFVEGIEGQALVAAMRAHAERYGVRFVRAHVEAIEPRPDGFALELTRQPAALVARRLLLATGVHDVPPALPHLAEALQAGALRYCPVCDGYEAMGQHIGIVADSGADVAEAIALRHYSDRISVFKASAAVAFSPAERQRLAEAGIALVEAPAERIRLAAEGGVTVHHARGETHCDTLYAALGLEVHSRLATRLGALHDDDGYLIVDAHQRTSVDGLWAAGDVAKGLNQIAVATGGAAIAAASMHHALSAA